MSRFNKASAAALAGAAATVIATLATVDPDVLAAGQTLLTALLVWLIPNRGA